MVDAGARDLIVHAALMAHKLKVPEGVPANLIETAYSLQKMDARPTPSPIDDTIDWLTARGLISVRRDKAFSGRLSLALTDSGVAFAEKHASRTKDIPALVITAISNALTKAKGEPNSLTQRKWSFGDLVKRLGDPLPGHGMPHTGSQRGSIAVTIFAVSPPQDHGTQPASISWDCFGSHDRLWSALRWAIELRANRAKTEADPTLEESLDAAISALMELASLTSCEAVAADDGSSENDRSWLYFACHRHSSLDEQDPNSIH